VLQGKIDARCPLPPFTVGVVARQSVAQQAWVPIPASPIASIHRRHDALSSAMTRTLQEIPHAATSCFSHCLRDSADRRSSSWFCTTGSAAQTPSHSGSLYKDPAGAFTVSVPANWEAQREAGSPLVSFVNAKNQASISMGVIHGDESTTPTPDKELEMIQGQFSQNCPQAKSRSAAPLHWAALMARSFL